MLTRRLGLLSSIAVFGAGPALAEKRPPASGAAHPGPQGRKTKDGVATGNPAETTLGRVDTAAKWAYIEDFDTGVSLLEKLADDEMPPSSMTKLMTMYIVYDRLRQGRLKLDDELPISEKAWRTQGSKMFVQVGTSVQVEDLIRGVIVQSGNDAAVVLAEAIAGSEEQFADAALQVDPTQPDAWVEAIQKLRKEPGLRASLITKGKERAARFTSDDFVRGLFQIMDEFAAYRATWPSSL